MSDKKAVFATEPVDWPTLAELNNEPMRDLSTGEPLEPKPNGQTWEMTPHSGPQEEADRTVSETDRD